MTSDLRFSPVAQDSQHDIDDEENVSDSGDSLMAATGAPRPPPKKSSAPLLFMILAGLLICLLLYSRLSDNSSSPSSFTRFLDSSFSSAEPRVSEEVGEEKIFTQAPIRVNKENGFSEVLQYHIQAPHEILDSRPFPREPAYFSTDLTVVPEFSRLHPPGSPFWLTIYALRYDYAGFFLATAMIHCLHSPGHIGCRESNLSPQKAFYGVLFNVANVEEEMNFLATGLACRFFASQEDFDANRPAGISRIRVKKNQPSHFEFRCKYPFFPALPANSSFVVIEFHGAEKNIQQANNGETTLKEALADLQAATSTRSTRVSLRYQGSRTFPALFRLPLPLIARWDRRYTTVQCFNAMRSKHYYNTIPDYFDHHLFMGVEHFAFYDRVGAYLPAVRSHVERGFVSYLHVPTADSWGWPNNVDQSILAQSCKYQFFYAARFLAYFDIDEYLTFPGITDKRGFYPPTCLAINEKQEIIARMTSESLEQSLDDNPVHQSLLPPVPADAAEAAEFSPANVAAELSVVYPNAVQQPCRSLLSDLLAVETYFNSFQFSQHTRYVSLPVSRAIFRSPEFFKAFKKAQEEKIDKKKGTKDSLLSSDRSSLLTALDHFSFPVMETFTFGNSWTTTKSIIEANSVCIPDIHLPIDCFEERPPRPLMNRAERIRYYWSQKDLPWTRAVFLHCQNVVGFNQLVREDEEFKDRYEDTAKKLFINNSNFFDRLTMEDQEKYLKKGGGPGFVRSAPMSWKRLQEWKRSGFRN